MSFLDTTFVVDLLREEKRGGKGPAHDKLHSLGEEPVRLSVFVHCELEAGVALAGGPRERDSIEALRKACEIAYPDERFAPRYGEILAALRRKGLTVATMDLLIATAALLENEPLITRNVKDFNRIPDLRVETY